MKLCQPFTLGTLNLKNRLVMSPMISNYATKDGYVSERMKDYYEARAKGGVGLIIIESACVGLSGKVAGRQLMIDNDKYIPGLRELAGTIHKHGTKTAIQIYHSGRVNSSVISGCQPIAPSAIPYPGDETVGVHDVWEMPKELTIDEIKEVEQWFAKAAARAKKAGFDAVELHAAHGYLLNEFLSPNSNKRQDQYGGDLEDRFRMLAETIAATKAAVGDYYPILCRINGDEPRIEGGATMKDAQEIAKMCQAAGIAAVDVSCLAGPDPTFLPMSGKKKGFLLHMAAAMKQAVSIPVIAVYRLTPEVGEKAIEEGKADLIAIGRGLLADPELPNKAVGGRLDEIMPCIACNTCQYNITSADDSLSCRVNPTTGKEKESHIIKAKKPKKVVVVGGGPGGMKAAIVAAQRGHKVTLFEKERKLGGQLILAAVPPYKDTILELTKCMITQAEKAGVSVVLGKEAATVDIESIGPDAVILAMGVKPFTPEIKGMDRGKVVLAEDVISGRAKVGQKVVVLGGELVGCETAELLADAGKKVSITRRGPEMAVGLHPWNRQAIMGRLTKKGVNMLTGVRYEEITSEGLVITNKEEQKQTVPADTIVLAAGGRPNTELLNELQGKPYKVYQVGDCLQPRSLLEAIAEGFSVGRTL